MTRATFRFYEELNDFLSPARRKVEFDHAWNGRASVKDLIESLGVPHTEVDLILVNGHSVAFGYHVAEGDRVSVYPRFEAMDIAPITRLRPEPLRDPRFVLDGHLGRLAAYLRLLGFDSRWDRDPDDALLADWSRREVRILLTRDRGLLKRNAVTHGYCVRADDPREQLREVMGRFDLQRRVRPFTRCLRCNGALDPLALEEARHSVRAGTAEHFHEFWQCRSCRKVYWKGSHYERMAKMLAETLATETCSPPL